MAAGVVKNETHGFKGRLGYACLNTILRFQKPPVFCSRTCRIDTIKEKGLDYVKELGRLNVLDLVKLVEWNEENNIKFMRMSSDMFPFASHDDWGYSLEYADEELKAIGVLAKKYGHRLTTHPGQFNQLGSPKSDVVRRT
ncbi:UV-damage endonuclease, partial [Bifiguratus adelaidae]